MKEIKCPSCEFTTTSEQGLKVHKKKKHTNQSFLKICSLCDKTFKTYQKFRDHKFEHTSWNRSKNTYSCKECDFIGNNMSSHEVHMGKAHSDIIDCGLCDLEFEKVEDLEIHITTCEIYQCRYCSKKEKTVSNIKKHTQSFHSDGAIIDHLKISRRNKEQVSEKMYWDIEL